MKPLFISIFALFCIFSAISCSKNNPASPDSEISSSAQNESSSSTKQSSSTQSSSSSSSPFTYYSSGTFCWSEPCEISSSSSSAKSSSSSIKSSSSSVSSSSVMSSSSAAPPVLNGNTLTDSRDGTKYSTRVINAIRWMTQSLCFETSSGSVYYNGGTKADYCENYGRLYTFAAAETACPEGWRLPTRREVTDVLDNDTWDDIYTGRRNGSNYGYKDSLGFMWVNSDPIEGDNSNGGCKAGVANCGVELIQKNPAKYSDKELIFFQTDQKSRYFSVRCVREE